MADLWHTVVKIYDNFQMGDIQVPENSRLYENIIFIIVLSYYFVDNYFGNIFDLLFLLHALWSELIWIVVI